MSGKYPSEKELKRALRLVRHIQSCSECQIAWSDTCFVGYGHVLRWQTTHWNEVKR